MAGRVTHYGNIVRDGLVLHLDAGKRDSYPGSGTVWRDLSGNNNHVTLYNAPIFSSNAIIFDGVNQYARTDTTINLADTDKITVMSIWKTATTSSQGLVYEHTNNWNTRTNGYGGFGIASNSNGSVVVANVNHNQLNGSTGYSGVNTTSPSIIDYQMYTLLHDFSLAGTDETYSYINGTFVNKSSTGVSGTNTINNTGMFGNDYMYFASRGGTTAYCNVSIACLILYNRRLTDIEISQNYNALRGRYGL